MILHAIAYDLGASNPSGEVQTDIRVPATDAMGAALKAAQRGR